MRLPADAKMTRWVVIERNESVARKTEAIYVFSKSN